MSRRDYCFTAWDEPKPDASKYRYVCWGEELCPTTHKQHYQGFIILNGTSRIPGVKRILGSGDGCHLEVRRGTRQEARDYCRKDGKFTELGRFDALTKEQLFHQPIDFLKKEYPEFYCRYHKGLERLQNVESPKWRDIFVTVLHGRPGTFKSRRARECDDWYSLEPPYKWFDGYYKQKRLIIDDFEWRNMSGTFLKRLLDGFPLQVETKGGHIHAHWTEVVITTNEEPDEWNIVGLNRRLNLVKRCTETLWSDVTV